MPTKSSRNKQSSKVSHQKEKPGFSLVISSGTHIAFSKAIILGLIVVVMAILAYHKIFEPVVWSSLMTMAGYVAFATPRSNTKS